MAEKLTDQQKAVVDDRGGKLLVSAAAGSGKTKVLVDRLLKFIKDPDDPANMDDFLIITFTKAAASELRGKIAEKLSERIAETPSDMHLQKQMQRLYLAKISTVHSFCSDVLREYAYMLDLPSDFRVAEDNECRQYRQSIMDKVLEDAYDHLESRPNVQAFLDSQGLRRNDATIPGIVSTVYENARCHKNPMEWLDKCVSSTVDAHITDASQTDWGKCLIENLHDQFQLLAATIDRCIEIARECDGFESVAEILRAEKEQLLEMCGCNTWTQIHEHPGIAYSTMSFPRKTPFTEEKELIQKTRDDYKKKIASLLSTFSNPNEQVLADLRDSGASASGIVELVKDFWKAYEKLKKSHRILDFSDLEHYMLDLVVGKKRMGTTTIGRELGRRFREIMVDEYQDTNEVQDAIFSALSEERHNCFMVGDVKQSIYQFRQADPEIFLKKYNEYSDYTKAAYAEPRKILLSKNFRSSEQVVDAVNDVFELCMSPRVGNMYYGEGERLVFYDGIAPATEPEVELYALESDEDTYGEEAQLVAERICQLLDSKHTIRSKNGPKTITPDDIVILLRSPNTNGSIFCHALRQRGIPCEMEKSEDLLQTEEVGALFSLLQVICNPLQDIPLVSTLTSRIFGFTADELAGIRAGNKKVNFYRSLCKSSLPKAKAFLALLDDFRRTARLSTVSELVEYILAKTSMDSIYAAMENGQSRVANLQSFFGLLSGSQAGGNRDLGQVIENILVMAKKGLTVSHDHRPEGSVMIYSIHKSKGLEYPVVFLSALSRKFNDEDIKEEVYCHKELGLGLACIDSENRVRYPTITKKAIAVRMRQESRSEELRILYVAMTRAKDRLIMTYAKKDLANYLTKLVRHIRTLPGEMITSTANDPGKWILYTALHRTEAGELFAEGGYPNCSSVSKSPWVIRYVRTETESKDASKNQGAPKPDKLPKEVVERIGKFQSFVYGHEPATRTPSKQTSTQLKGRIKDSEAAENTASSWKPKKRFRKPGFVQDTGCGTAYGNAVHGFMQHVNYTCCADIAGIEAQIARMCGDGLLTEEQGRALDRRQLLAFFESELGQRLQAAGQVLREFKFSLLDDADHYSDCDDSEKVLLQGVVDCAIVEPDGISVIDFKTDKVTEETVGAVAQGYSLQVQSYARSLSRIYELPVKESYLYFFRAAKAVKIP